MSYNIFKTLTFVVLAAGITTSAVFLSRNNLVTSRQSDLHKIQFGIMIAQGNFTGDIDPQTGCYRFEKKLFQPTVDFWQFSSVELGFDSYDLLCRGQIVTHDMGISLL